MPSIFAQGGCGPLAGTMFDLPEVTGRMVGTGMVPAMSDDPRSVLTRPAPPPTGTVRYGNAPEQVVDLRLPATVPDSAKPLVVVIHGGFWRAEYDRRHTGPLAAALAGLGYPVAQLEYRRVGQPGGGWPGTLNDVLAGLAALPALVGEVLPPGVRAPGPPVLLGHSAGGQLALYAAAERPSAVRAVVALAPVADLAEAYRLDLDSGAVAALLGGGPEEVPQRYAAADPIRRVTDSVRAADRPVHLVADSVRTAADPIRSPVGLARTVIVHGLLDRQVPIELSRRFVSAAGMSGRQIDLIELAKCEHFGLIDPMSSAWPAVTSALGAAAGPVRGH